MEIDLDRERPGKERANAEAERWNASERSYRKEKRLERIEAWSYYYLGLADFHEKMADENRERAARLFAERR